MTTPQQGSHDPPSASDQDIQAMMERMFVSDPSIESVTWTRTKDSESVTLSRSPGEQGRPFSPPATSRSPSQSHITSPQHQATKSSCSPPITPTPTSSHGSPVPTPHQLPTSRLEINPRKRLGIAAQLRQYEPPIPAPSDLQPPTRPASKYYVITVGQEVGIFNNWPDVAERVDGVSGNRHKSYGSWGDALEAYVHYYNAKAVRAVPKPGGRFWPRPPSSMSTENTCQYN